MDKTLAIRQLAEFMATQNGYKAEFCEKFVMEMFRTIAEGLKESDEVKIKGFGEFRVNETRDNILFRPEDSVAEEINEPFSLFQAEELDDDITEEILLGKEMPNASVPITNVEETAETEVEEVADETTEQEPAPELIVEHVDESEETIAEEPQAETATTKEQSEPEAIYGKYEPDEPRRGYGGIMFFAGLAIGLIIGAAAVYFIPGLSYKQSQPKQLEVEEAVVEQPEAEPIPADTIATVSMPDSIVADATHTPEPINQQEEKSKVEIVPVTDVVKTTLAALSRKHYGTFEFWVYIFEENKAKFSHPDRVETGVSVVIPDKAKYGIDKNNPASIKRAKELSDEIYSRYK